MANLQTLLITIGTEKRTALFNGILNAGIAYQMGGQWRSYMLTQYAQSSGNIKKIYKALARATPQQIELIMRHLV